MPKKIPGGPGGLVPQSVRLRLPASIIYRDRTSINYRDHAQADPPSEENQNKSRSRRCTARRGRQIQSLLYLVA